MHARRAARRDGPAIRRICRGIYPGGDYVEDMLRAWTDGGSLYVADAGRAVGVFAVTLRGRTAWLQGMRVDAQLQGRGLGAAMCEMAEGVALGLGAGRMGALAGSARGLGMLEGAGYRGAGQVGAYALGGAPPDWDGFGRAGRAGGTRGRYVDSWTVQNTRRGDAVVRRGGTTVKLAGSGSGGTSLTVLEWDRPGMAALARYVSGSGRQRRWWRGLTVLCVDCPAGPLEDAGFCAVGRYPIMEKGLAP